MACGARLPDRLEWLREAVAAYITEETGHQDWILNDLSACGANAEAVRLGSPGQATDVMVAYAWDTVQRRNPVGFFGMVLVLEGTSVAIATRAAAAIREATGLPDTAFSYLTSHGALDQQHMITYEQLVNRLELAEDREAVVRTARVMYRLYGGMFRSLSGDANREAA
jgi:pyrroloquinoline quinone (PQQ) biosynthesis protein C